MSEFDDLFDKQFAEKNSSKEKNIVNFHKTISSQKHNGLLLLIYIIINIIFAFVTMIYFSFEYPDTDVTLENIDEYDL